MGSKSVCHTRSELLELCRHLRQEKLFVENEKASLRDLNERVKKASQDLALSAWTARAQRVNLDELLLKAGDPSSSVLRANLVKKTHFQDAYKMLQHHEILYTEFLKTLRQKPKLLGQVLSVGCKRNIPGLEEVECATFSGLYGSCFMAEDEVLTLELLHHLMSAQLASSPNPRKILRAGKCSFSRIYKSFIEEIFSTKLFLTTALFEPILSLLTEDEIFLDIDPSKALIRFPPSERKKKFGIEGTPEYQKRLKDHREFIIKKLENITRKFINGIQDNIRSFPPSLSRLLRAMYSLLIKSFELKEVHAICFDAIFYLFICPAIVDPNPVGIIDTPVSYIARSNLMQVAHILQVLCMQKWEEIDPKHMDLFSRFDKDSMSSIFENILELGLSNNEESIRKPLTESNTFAGMGMSAGTAAASNFGFNDGSKLSRLAVLMTKSQLNQLVLFLRHIRDINNENKCDNLLPSSMANELTALLAPLPEIIPGGLNGVHENKMEEIPVSKSSQSKNSLSARLSAMKNGSNSHRVTPLENNFHHRLHQEADNVLVIPLFDPSTSYDLPGLLSEEQVLSRSRQNSRVRMTLPNSDGSGNEVLEKRTRFSLSQDEGSIGNTSDNLEAISEAASNHSATSSLEDGDDQEDEDNPIIDNLSDMVSANVSGRGTPNVSGRDTPSSQVEGVPDDDEVIRSGRNEGEEDEARGAIGGMVGLRTGQASRGHRHIPPNKSGQADLEEKFGRFEIKPQIKSRGSGVGLAGEGGDETVSLISDTWSTDVLASDTETLGEILTTSSDRFPHNNQNFADMDPFSRNLILEEFATSSSAGAAAALPQRMSGIQPSMPSDSTSVNLLDVGDTASEAWSIDVLDGDRESLCLGELDIEYISSTVSAEDNQYMEGISQSGRNTDILLVDDNSPVANRAEARGNNLSRPSRDAAIEQWACSSGVGNIEHQDGAIRRGSDSSSSAAVAAQSPTSSKLPLGMEKAPLEDPNQATLSSHLSAASIASSSGSSGDAADSNINASSRKNVLVPSSSTGAIPKCANPDKKSGRSEKFSFKNWKLPKISRSRSSVESLRSSSDKCFSSHSNSLDNPSHSVDGPPLGSLQRSHESSDDILNKYRNKKPVAVGNLIDITDSLAEEEVDPRLIIDHNNLENCYAFQDAKRKLRLTLSSVDLSMMPDICHASSVEPEVIWLLKVQLSEALNLQDRNFIAQLHETLRCLSLFKKDGVSRILNSLKEEYKRRAPYMAYLVRCRQGLLCTLSRQERLLSRMNIDRDVCASYLVYVVVRIFLENREKRLHHFVQEFKELTVPDEKTALMNSFLALMNKELEHDPIWSSVCSTEQLKLSNIAIERSITSHIYFHAMYPNGEADINRDEVLSEHIRKLGEIITPSHKCLRIPRQYHYEQPWPSAQAEIRRLAAFKTPADKVSCIKRASQTIMNLLSLGSSKGVPAADDFIPVLVFILIKANPPSLLSTVQYVENFYGERLCGEDEYWWVQTVSAIEFIKTMDY
ncbi:LOW QUALITY PROTEIN: GTPase-activating protein and VPS9 domain-containing protein 1 [Lepeophtheirus salmonis]|uniref:LOW QUALITY PROTEIN: GTPase-activating protein and VPS9 domain-containing protein 1 n=1 Tax=Lepeophtheirus salmonis TaxID=72036 RepID=UPI003AF3D137